MVETADNMTPQVLSIPLFGMTNLAERFKWPLLYFDYYLLRFCLRCYSLGLPRSTPWQGISMIQGTQRVNINKVASERTLKPRQLWVAPSRFLRHGGPLKLMDPTINGEPKAITNTLSIRLLFRQNNNIADLSLRHPWTRRLRGALRRHLWSRSSI